jgi:serine/threonine protein kinase
MIIFNSNNSNFRVVQKFTSKNSTKVFLVQTQDRSLKVCKLFKSLNLNQNQNQSEEFFKELSTIPLLSHKNIISLSETSANSLYIKSASHSHDCSAFITEYFPQGNLLGLMRTHNNGLEEEVGKGICKQIASGLEFMHSKGLAHCDVRLENLLITNEGVVKIIDFELVQPTIDFSKCWTGSNYYRAPEVIRKDLYLPEKTDVFAAGCTFFPVFFGFPAFHRASPDDRLYQELQKRPESFWRKVEARADKRISFHLKDLLEKMLKDQPDERLSMSEVLEEL